MQCVRFQKWSPVILPNPYLCQTLVSPIKLFQWLWKSSLLLLWWPFLLCVFFMLGIYPERSRAWPSCVYSTCPLCIRLQGWEILMASCCKKDTKQWVGQGGLNISREKGRQSYSNMISRFYSRLVCSWSASNFTLGQLCAIFFITSSAVQ